MGLIIILFVSILIWLIVALRWRNFHQFFHTSYTLMDIAFISAYFFEQIFLVILLATTSFSTQVVVGLFAIVVVTTVSLQNRAWESRLNLIGDRVVEQRGIISFISKRYKEISDQNKILLGSLEKSQKFIDKLVFELEKSEKKLKKKK
jgi:hypothetical protein